MAFIVVAYVVMAYIVMTDMLLCCTVDISEHMCNACGNGLVF